MAAAEVGNGPGRVAPGLRPDSPAAARRVSVGCERLLRSDGRRRPVAHLDARMNAVTRFAAFTASLPEWTPEEAVQVLAELGYDGVEWRVVDQIDAPEPSFWFGNRCTLPLSSFVDDAPRI